MPDNPQDDTDRSVNLNIYEDRGATVIDVLEDQMTGQTQINAFARRVAAEVSRLGNRSVIINCKQVQWVSSRMLGTLVEMHRKLASRKAQMRLVHLSESVREVLTVTRLDGFLNVQPSLEQAFASLE